MGVASLRIAVGLVVIATAWACELGSDPPTQVPLEEADDALAQAYCERMFDCQCDRGRRFETIEQCRDWIDEEITQLESEASGADLTYDPTCFGIIVDRLDALDCAPTLEGDDECVAPCFPLHGDVPVGEPCERSSDYSNCAQGLECQQDECDEFGTCTGRCVDPCAPRPGIGQDCADGCAAGLTCYYNLDEPTCGRLPELGDDCSDTGQCAAELRCEFDPMTDDNRCVALTAFGESCTGHTQCASGFCPAGFCDRLPGEGDSCEGTFACTEGLDCDPDTQVCVPGDALVCQLSFQID